jgi:hypothetical protein
MVVTLGEFVPSGSGSTQQFTVQVGDPAGASAVQGIQPFFSQTPGSNGSILSAIGSNSCGMYYVASAGLLYLNDAAGDDNWVGYSSSGGSWSGSNSNGVCQVNSWSVTASGDYVTLYVNVTFLQAETWYEYLSALTSSIGQWTSFYCNGMTWVMP